MSELVSGPARGGRREDILASASRLFARHGYTSTGIDEIGEAAGITGPGVYRHFDNKSEVLSEVARRATDRLMQGVERVTDERGNAADRLHGLVRNMLRCVLDDQEGWVVALRDHRYLTPTAAARIAGAYGDHMQEWARALSEVRPDLAPHEVRVIVRCVSAFAAPLVVPAALPRARAEALLEDAALAVLHHLVPERPAA